MLSAGGILAQPQEDEHLASAVLLDECGPRPEDPRNDPFVTSGASMQGRRGDLSRAPGASNEGRSLHRDNVPQRTPTRTPSPENVWQPNRRYGESSQGLPWNNGTGSASLPGAPSDFGPTSASPAPPQVMFGQQQFQPAAAVLAPPGTTPFSWTTNMNPQAMSPIGFGLMMNPQVQQKPAAQVNAPAAPGPNTPLDGPAGPDELAPGPPGGGSANSRGVALPTAVVGANAGGPSLDPSTGLHPATGGAASSTSPTEAKRNKIRPGGPKEVAPGSLAVGGPSNSSAAPGGPTAGGRAGSPVANDGLLMCGGGAPGGGGGAGGVNGGPASMMQHHSSQGAAPYPLPGGGAAPKDRGGKGDRRRKGDAPLAPAPVNSMSGKGGGGACGGGGGRGGQHVVEDLDRPLGKPRDGGGGGGGGNGGGNGGGGRPSSSPIIEQLKQRDRPVELSELLPHIGEIAQDQWGSRLIQQKLGVANAEEKQRAFQAIISKMPQLMIDVFGNYVIQKFFEFGDHQQRKILAEHLVGQVLPLSMQMYGCRVVQKAIESVQTEQQVLLVGELKGKVLECVEDQHGNHVIQKCIERLPTDKIYFIVEAFDGQVMRMAKHCYGCRVIQRLIEYCTDVQLSRLLDEVVMNVQELGTDQYGNYVVQHVLEHSQRPHDRPHLLQIVADNILALSCHKYASNVVEKALHCGTMDERTGIIGAMIADSGTGQPHLNAMMKDKFGNYIVQRSLNLAQGPQRDMLLRKVETQMPALKKSNTYGKHIIAAYNSAKGT
mmetsp:Transcript_29593/g.68872  ORF Transcript_29593/g.68872 Transcript_29593/m.68872 type:complete len:771 (+) Transcript_29593:128-2440(+)|eukprot:CAMPEP_0178443750 /NCGR_PEP_ID=MMETSP0689_2-20121128/39085_1 /TAXON_ID=160604 /ORGANISM="Amphidinium massartii, Strain CS-259" /LENGTH=770 /DNA_ID=CAMNT_0020067825 /DNA_START=80 /DNA_END=2392 /DNA_ORIENTATION=-